MTAYYNEIDPNAAEWLRELIKADFIAPGVVDERSIEDISPNDLNGYTQCHFFAGIGVWSYALRQAGWPDDRQVWTGSCPCQPFSAAGKGKGIDDERHLWPAFHWLIKQCRPDVIFGEQVAGKAGESWLDIVQTDLEGEDYTSGAVVFPACGIGAPHMRKRTYWMGHTKGWGEWRSIKQDGFRDQGENRAAGESSGMANDNSKRFDGVDALLREGERRERGTEADTEATGRCEANGTAPTNGFWRDADWLGCRDGKWRPVIASFIEVANGTPFTMGFVRDTCTQDNQIQKKEKVNDAIQAEKRSVEEVLTVWLHDVAQSIQEGKPIRGYVRIQEEKILRQILYVESDGTGCMHPQTQQNESKQNNEGFLRDMWEESTTCTPQGHQSFKQQDIQLTELMCELSSTLSLAKLHGDRITEVAVLILQQRLAKEQTVFCPHISEKETWASISEEAKARVIMGVDVRAWRRMVFFPLETGAEAKTMRLKGYGNAIVAEQAQAFIEAAGVL